MCVCVCVCVCVHACVRVFKVQGMRVCGHVWVCIWGKGMCMYARLTGHMCHCFMLMHTLMPTNLHWPFLYRNVMSDITRLLFLLNKKPENVEMPPDGMQLLEWSEQTLHHYLESQVGAARTPYMHTHLFNIFSDCSMIFNCIDPETCFG